VCGVAHIAHEALRRSRRFEVLHLSLPPPNRLMRVFGPIVLSQALLMPS
jgi:hypothetical protein